MIDILGEGDSGPPSLMVFVSCVLPDNYIDIDKLTEGTGHKEYIKNITLTLPS